MAINPRIFEGFAREMEKIGINGVQMRTSLSPTAQTQPGIKLPMGQRPMTPAAPLTSPMMQPRKSSLPPTAFSSRVGIMGTGRASTTPGQFGRL